MLVIALGLLVGLVLGLTGAGGSILAVPLLMVGLGWSLQRAAPVALCAVAVAAAIGSAAALKQGLVRYRAATLMAAVGILTAPLGIAAASQLPHAVLTVIFSAVLVVVAVRMLLQARDTPEEASAVRASLTGKGGEAICRLNPATGRIRWTSPCAMALATAGALTGFLTGLLGVGGGFVIVPMLRRMTELTIHGAVATSLMVIMLVSSSAVLSAWAQHQPLPLVVAAPFVLGAVLGMGAGRYLAPRIAGPRLQQGFAVLLLIIAAGLSAQALGLMTP